MSWPHPPPHGGPPYPPPHQARYPQQPPRPLPHGAHVPQHGQWAQHQVYSPQYAPTYAQPNPTSRPMMRTWLLSGLVVFGSLLAALVFAAIFGFSYGIFATLLGLIFAVIPLGIVLPLFLWLDRFEAEPWRYIVTAFLYGALGSTLLALVVNTIGGAVLAGYTDPTSAMTLSAVLIAPVSEETFKGIFLLIMLWLRRKEFNGLTDGIVYAGIVAAGFAFTENILYLARTYVEVGGSAFAVVFVMRGIASPFLHPMFTSMTGIGVGIAASTRSLPVKIVAPIAGWCVGVLGHGLWNLAASSGLTGAVVGWVLGFIVFVAFIAFVIWTRTREGRVIGQFLRPYADTGWLSPGEVSMLSSMRQRREARSWAKLNGGSHSLKAMRAFQDSASELALLRARMHHHKVDDAALRTERVLLDSMTARRREFAGMSIR